MTGWFSVVSLGDGVHLVAEPGHVNSYLVQGGRRAVLFDTGLGIGEIRTVVSELTDLPVTVVNSHSHLDHRGGNHGFDDVRAHRAAATGLAASYSAADLSWFADYADRVHDAYEAGRAADDDYFHVHDAALAPRPAPDAEVLGSWTVPACTPTAELCDGDVIDLGDRALRVIHVPGHTPDSLVLHEADTGIVLAGDTLVAGVSYAHLPGADLSGFGESVARLEALTRGRRSRLLLAHTMRYEMPGDFLDEVSQAWAGALAPELEWRLWRDMFGTACERTDFRRFSISRPIEGAGSAVSG